MIKFLARFEENPPTAYLKAHLKPGIRVLDLGCGPGYLSVWLADLLAPGRLYGIDVEPSQVEHARQVAAERGCDNAEFEVADAVDLPFEDGFFDLVHCNNVLAYVPDTKAVLAEAQRVLKPGGILGCREPLVESSFFYPGMGGSAKGFAVFGDILAADDGHPEMGKSLKTHLDQAGFLDIKVSASFEIFSEPDEVDAFYHLVKDWFLSWDIIKSAKMYGAATDSLFKSVELAIENWRQHHGAVAAIAAGEAVAVCP